ncbi:MAG: ABC transporter ATP-binding protein [Clostridiales bacterium]|nr:ABC transporter ATP-binding protein [Clostridiales bacterium]
MAKPMSYKRPKNTKKTLLRLLKYLGRHKISMAAVAFLVLVSSGANILGTYLLKPVINRFIEPHDTKGLLTAVLLMALMYAAGALATLGYNKLMVRTAQKTVSEIRSDLFAHTQKLPLSYFDVHTHGELMSRFTNDVDTVTEALNNSFTLLIQSFIMTVGTVIMLVVLNFRLSLIVIGFLILMLLYILFNSKMSKKYFKRQQNALGSINGFVEEIVDGQKVEKVFNHEDEDFAEFCKRNEAYRVSATKALSYSGMMVPSIVSLSYFNYAISACVGGLFVLRGLTDIGSLASYLVYVRQSAMPMNQFTQQANFILSALSGAERIFDMMDTPCEPDEGKVSLCNVKEENGQITECTEHTRHFAWKTKDADGRTQLVPLKGDVRFHDVSFGYTPEKKILDHIDLYAKPGQKIAFVGSTGAGKTTIINLITRFYEIDGGKITYDGIDIRDIKKDDLRRSLSVVVQDTHLFTGSIKDNIRYGNQGATDEDVVHAAKIANADSFIRRLPNGYDTVISGDGDNLSQGQRQLLAIARAAASKPPVLILDEATSSIDTRTEKLIEKSMDALMENRTVFVIAHRLSTVRNSHAILVIEKGKIIERGSHEELLAKHGRYYQLYTGVCELA